MNEISLSSNDGRNLAQMGGSTLIAAVLTAPYTVINQELPIPVAGPEDVLIRVRRAGICGSDIHAYRGAHPFRRPPVVLGHEIAGEVVEVGDRVKKFSVGSRVTVMPQDSCGRCRPCRTGYPELCLEKRVPGVDGWLGALADYFVAPASSVFELPPLLSWDTAVLSEPLAVGFHAANISMASIRDRVTILGGGSIGLCCLLALRARGVRHIAVTDISDNKLEIASTYGAVSVCAGKKVIEDITDAVNGPSDIVIVTTEYPGILDDALAISGPHSQIILLSLFEQPTTLNSFPMVVGEKLIRGSITYNPDDFTLAVETLRDNAQWAQRMVSRITPLSDAANAFRELDKGNRDIVKIILSPGEA